MSTQAVPTPETKPAEPKKKEKKRRTFTVSMFSTEGAKLKFVLRYKKDGACATHAVHSAKDAKGKKVNSRGATKAHTTEEAAVVTMEKMVADAEKLGWIRKVRSSGFKAKPDAFDVAHLPAPVVAKGTSKK